MTRTSRHSRRQSKKAKRKAARKKTRRNGGGKKAGSIAIHSRLPGLEGTEIGSMDVVVDARRKEQHPALINVAIHQRREKRAVIWSIETGFGGQAPRVGYQVIPDGAMDRPPETTWFPDVADASVIAANDNDQAEVAQATPAEEPTT